MDNKVGPKSDPPSDGEAMGFRGLSQYQTEYSTTRQCEHTQLLSAVCNSNDCVVQ